MLTERLVKWSKEGKEFFEKAKDNSIVLDLAISIGCASQSGLGFEDLVNTINSENIKRKIKKVNITNTTYLYRHCVPEFDRYCGKNITATSLKIIEEIYEGKLSEQDKRMLKTAIRSIEGMAEKMLEKYRISRNREEGRGVRDIGKRDTRRGSREHDV
jgi:hypothetical protein